MVLRDATFKAAMQDLADRVRRDTLELVAKHLEDGGERLAWTVVPTDRPVWLSSWNAAAAEVRAIATRAEFNAITERIQP